MCYRAASGSLSQLFGTLMILKAACQHNHCYIDRLIASFMRVLQRMVREHLAPNVQQENNSGTYRPLLNVQSKMNSADLALYLKTVHLYIQNFKP